MVAAHGRLIAIEGGDGAGKTSLIAALMAALAGQDVLLTREPGGTPEGLALRAILLAQTSTVWDPRAELLLMTAARVQHVARVIRPALQAGRLVLCDRFIGSTLAYQGGGQGIDPALILRLHHDMVGDLWPDLTLLLDIDPAAALARSHRRLQQDPAIDEGRFEAMDLAFHHRVRATYCALAASRPGWVTLDAAQPLEHVAAAALAAIG
jgi:dTMP kinase